jgi:potassium-transporting ATPase potassium-binding subunit
MATVVALIRGLVRQRAQTIGNFWVDLTRSTIRILLPLSLVVAVVLVGQGVIQNFHGFIAAHSLEGVEQLVPGGPAASQVAIKQLGTNGGGFFNTNLAHPFENPGGFTNLVEMWARQVCAPTRNCWSYPLLTWVTPARMGGRGRTRALDETTLGQNHVFPVQITRSVAPRWPG